MHFSIRRGRKHGGILSIAFVSAALTLASPGAAATPDDVIRRYAETHPQAPGVAAAIVADGGKTHWQGAIGQADRSKGKVLRADLPFRIASVTKLYTAAAILCLSEQRKLDVESPITPYISGRTAALLKSNGYDPDIILIRHLMTHTSGLPDYAQTDAFRAAVMTTPAHEWTRAEQIEFAVVHAAAAGKPGEAFAYSDTGYIILGEIIERSTGASLGVSFETLLRLDHRGLRHTRMERGGDMSQGVIAKTYMDDMDISAIDPSFDLFGGGGLVSTVDDLARFVRAAYRGELFGSPSTLALALARPATQQPTPHSYALMGTPVEVGRHICWGHSGYWNIYAVYCPKPDIAIAVTLNAHAGNLSARALLEDLIDAQIDRSVSPGIAR